MRQSGIPRQQGQTSGNEMSLRFTYQRTWMPNLIPCTSQSSSLMTRYLPSFWMLGRGLAQKLPMAAPAAWFLSVHLMESSPRSSSERGKDVFAIAVVAAAKEEVGAAAAKQSHASSARSRLLMCMVARVLFLGLWLLDDMFTHESLIKTFACWVRGTF